MFGKLKPNLPAAVVLVSADATTLPFRIKLADLKVGAPPLGMKRQHSFMALFPQTVAFLPVTATAWFCPPFCIPKIARPPFQAVQEGLSLM